MLPAKLSIIARHCFLMFAGAAFAILPPSTLAGADRPGITYDVEGDDREVSGAVYNEDGRLLRTLLRAAERDAGKYTVKWDGLDRLGRPQPPGEYEIRLLSKPPFKREFVMQIGVNPSSKPYHRWVGDFGGGTSVAVHESGMYISSQNAEGNFMLLKQSMDGTKRMWACMDVDPWQGGISLGADGERVYVLQKNAYITLFDAETGEHTGRWDVLPEEERDPKRSKRKRRRFDYTRHGPLAKMDMAISGEHRVITNERADVVIWLNKNGEPKTSVKGHSPRGVAIGPDGIVYVISQERVYTVSQDGAWKTVVSDLVNPWRLAVDPTSGDLLVAEGPDDWRVKRFSADGAFISFYGREGGRLEGPYEATDFKYYTDITTDCRGGFFVAQSERPPRRVAHFDDEGELVQEWYGGLTFFSPRTVDPRDPTQVWYKSGAPETNKSEAGWVLAEVDYEEGTWAIKETYEIASKAKGLIRSVKFQIRYHGDERYLVGESFPPVIFHHHDGQIDPVVVGGIDRRFPGYARERVARVMTGSDDEVVLEEWRDEHFGKANRRNNTYLWVDSNGDRTPQADEMTLGKLGNIYHHPGKGPFIADDFSVIAGGGYKNPDRHKEGEPGQYTTIIRYSPDGWSGVVPQYSLPGEASDMDVAPLYPTDAYGRRTKVRHTFQDQDDALYALYDWPLGQRGFGGFPTHQAGRYARLTKWTADGTLQWSVGRKANGANKAAIHWRPTDPGAFHYPVRIAGEVRGTIVVCDRIVNPGMAWTNDGLFAGSFFPGRVDDGLPGWVYAWQRDMETNTHSIVNHDCAEGGSIIEHEGDVYFLSPGCNSVVVYRVHGYDPNDWKRTSATVSIDEECPHASAAGTGLRVEFYEGMEISGAPDAIQEGVYPSELTVPEGLNTDNGIAIRLSGEIEAPISESFTFRVWGGALRMWVDGDQVLEYWNESWPVARTDPVELSAGRRVPIQIDFATIDMKRFTDEEKHSVSLSWKSLNTDPDDIPRRFLYPAPIDAANVVEPRPATSRIHARSHDHTISSDGVVFDSFHCRHHMKGLKGKHLGYRRIDFGNGVETFLINLRRGNTKEITVELRLDAPDGPLLDTVTLPEVDIEYRTEKTLELDVDGQDVEGLHDLYIVTLITPGRHGPRMRWFSFE